MEELEITRKCPKCGGTIIDKKSELVNNVKMLAKGSIILVRPISGTAAVLIGGDLIDTFIESVLGTDKSKKNCYNCKRKWTFQDEAEAWYKAIEKSGQYDKYIVFINIIVQGLKEKAKNNNYEILNAIEESQKRLVEAWKPNKDGKRKFLFTRDVDEEDRKIILVARSADDLVGFRDTNNVINCIFTRTCLPPDIIFPLSKKPQTNSFYIINPVKPNEYLPYENYEEQLFLDKVRELKRILRNLGATEITYTSVKGKSIDELKNLNLNLSAEGADKESEAKASAAIDFGKRINRMSRSGYKIDYAETLNPSEEPSLPSNLHWYENEPEWIDKVEARLHHGLESFDLSISTNNISSLDKEIRFGLNAAYEDLMLKIGGHINVTYEHHLKTSEETEWHITAKFKPLSDFNNNLGAECDKHKIILSSEEKGYFEAIKGCLDNGEISESERYVLEIKRKELGISEQRASELEALLAPQLTKNEQVYQNLYRERAEAGEITEDQRNFLNQAAQSLGLSPERVKHLEANF